MEWLLGLHWVSSQPFTANMGLSMWCCLKSCIPCHRLWGPECGRVSQQAQRRGQPLWIRHDSNSSGECKGRDKGKFGHELWACGSGISRVLLTFVVAWTGAWEWYVRAPQTVLEVVSTRSEAGIFQGQDIVPRGQAVRGQKGDQQARPAMGSWLRQGPVPGRH